MLLIIVLTKNIITHDNLKTTMHVTVRGQYFDFFFITEVNFNNRKYSPMSYSFNGVVYACNGDGIYIKWEWRIYSMWVYRVHIGSVKVQ